MAARIGIAALILSLLLSACGAAAESAPPAPETTPRSISDEIAPQTGRDYPGGTIGAFLAADDRFSVFLALMEDDDFLLARMHADPRRSFTLFVPTNEAFSTLDAHTQSALATDSSLVTGIVERHFMPRRLTADEFVNGFVFTGMSRRASRLALVVDGERLWFGDARIVEVDLDAGSGIVHVISGVNLGPTPERRPIP